MPPLDRLPPARISPLSRIWMLVLRGYLVVSVILLIVKAIEVGSGVGG